ncbi:MAG TPA: site-2 protease family protein [Candidatus Acidoferrum sp.]|nr:site-2 protease family protein [Candidatus Acidoferrum sp.]
MVAAIIAFSLLIISHELGHFFAAKWAGIAVLEFSIGMGPKVVGFTKNGTAYSLRLLPIGGYVRMEGEEDGMELPDEQEKAGEEEKQAQPIQAPEGCSFPEASIGRRAFTMFAGPAMNLATAFFAMTLLVISIGVIPSTTVASYKEENVSAGYGLMPGDKIVAIEGEKIRISSDIVYSLMRSGGRPLDLVVLREGETFTLSDIAFPTYVDQGVTFSYPDFYCTRLSVNPLTVARESIFRCYAIVREVYTSVVGLVRGEIPLSQLSGPVATTQAIGEVSKQGFNALVYFMVFISINIGVINLLPFPALDGGRLLLIAIEVIRGKPLKREAEGWINFAGFAALMTLVVYVTYQDIVKLFK